MLSTILWGTLVLSGAGILRVLQGTSPGSCESTNCTLTTTQPTTQATTQANKQDKIDYYKETYNYCKNLSLDELHDYIDYNYDLHYWDYKIYNTCSRDNKDLIIKHMAELADKNQTLYNNRFKRY